MRTEITIKATSYDPFIKRNTFNRNSFSFSYENFYRRILKKASHLSSISTHPPPPPPPPPLNNNKFLSQQMLTGGMLIINEFDENSLGSEHDSPFPVPRPRNFARLMLPVSRGPRIHSSRIALRITETPLGDYRRETPQ